MDRKSLFEGLRRVVVKVGSNVLTADSGLNLTAIGAITGQICRLIDDGVQVILVSSGSMASGIRKIGLSRRPEEIPKRQAVSAVGQAGLILEYENAFERYGRKVGQILLTSDDLTYRQRYLNSRNTLLTLLDWQVVPIINENDTVMVEEIKVGDNDNLSAMIALLMEAGLLINLTDIDGLYDCDPRTHGEARLIPEVTVIDRGIEKLAGGIPGALGTGGMLSKVQAARKVTAAGIPMIIASGSRPDILLRLFAGETHGTLFVPRSKKLASRKRWLAFSVKPQGTLRIDAGAAEAVLRHGKSLLPSGIVAVEGEFGEGSPVQFATVDDRVVGSGLVNYNARDIRRIMGLRSSEIRNRLGEKPYDEVIHRDNLVVLPEFQN